MNAADLTLMHYAAAPVTFDPARTYENVRRWKPDGLWVSVAGMDDWPSWCRSEEWGVGRIACEHRVTLSSAANILTLGTEQEVRDLAERYPSSPADWQRQPFDPAPDWRAIAAGYDGIIIAPYQWGCRLDTHWYYGWDCASGCVWDLSAIESVALVATPQTVVSGAPPTR